MATAIGLLPDDRGLLSLLDGERLVGSSQNTTTVETRTGFAAQDRASFAVYWPDTAFGGAGGVRPEWRRVAPPALGRGMAGSDGGAAGAGENPFAGDIFVVRQARRPGLLKNLSSGWIHAIFVDMRGGISAGWGVEGA